MFSSSASDDDGASWSAPAALNSDAPGVGEDESRALLLKAGASDWLAAWSVFVPSGPVYNIAVARSTDNGATWGTRAIVRTFNGQTSVAGVGSGASGEWFLLLESADPLGAFGSDSDILLARSTDDGATWALPEAVNDDAASDDVADTLASLTHEGGAKWFAAWTRIVDTGLGGPPFTDWNLYGARSTDNGATWTPAERLNSNPLATGGVDKAPTLARTGSGRWVLVWDSTEDLDGMAGGDDSDIFFALSDTVPVELSFATLE